MKARRDNAQEAQVQSYTASNMFRLSWSGENNDAPPNRPGLLQLYREEKSQL